MSANPLSLTRSRRQRRRRRRTIRSAPSSRMSARCPCRTSGWKKSRPLAKSQKIIPTRLTFVDIAGLVRGASKGEGLGNQFLANIRECDAIAYVLRCFDDGDVTHVEGRVDPIADAETVETELMLADLESLERRRHCCRKEGEGPGQGSQSPARAHGRRAQIRVRGQARAARTCRASGIGASRRSSNCSS